MPDWIIEFIEVRAKTPYKDLYISTEIAQFYQADKDFNDPWWFTDYEQTTLMMRNFGWSEYWSFDTSDDIPF